MQYLLDTHAILWYFTLDESLSNKAKEVIDDKENKIYISITSFWEMAIKSSIGKLDLSLSFDEFLEEMAKQNMELLLIDMEDIKAVEKLILPEESRHRDPFDRLLIVQAINKDLTLISKDKNFKHYKVNQLW